jgi:hypothetical protein
MSEPTKEDGLWVNSRLFTENFNKLPRDQVLRYAGQHVAFNLDGTQILASGADEMEMERRLVEVGIDPARVVGMYIPREDEATLF